MPLYFIRSIDGNGQSEIVAIFLLTEEEESILTSAVEIFKRHNQSWSDINVILTDKDMVGEMCSERQYPMQNFSYVRSFKREITPEKLGITQGEKLQSLEPLQNMAYSKSDEAYDRLYEQFCSEVSPAVITYYNRNWHPIKNQWVDGLKEGVNLGTRTNNRIESINHKVKSVLRHHSALPEFLLKAFWQLFCHCEQKEIIKLLVCFKRKLLTPLKLILLSRSIRTF